MEDLKKELKDMGSLLDHDIRLEDREIPEDYFKQLQNRVLADLSSSESTGKVPLLNILRPALYTISGIAAMLILAFGIWHYNKSVQQDDPSGIQSLDQELVYSYLEENIDDLSLDMLATDKHMEEEMLIDHPQNEEEWEILLEDVEIYDIDNIF